jgi:hypothetical protein
MFQAVLIASLAASAVAFRPAVMARPSLTKVSMSAEGLAGQTAPLGFFDPLSLSAGKTDGEIKVAMSNLSDNHRMLPAISNEYVLSRLTLSSL